ncbi:MAG TPA: OmpH family outer membrane protein [Steroidobacteraceae bacterium]|nr:OmpH family outer membrane protein [Steroidobacteraceae bacterium]
MRRRVKFVALLGVLALAASAAPAWADLKIGVVNYSKLMQESPQAKTVQEALRGEFAGRQKDLQGQQVALKAKEEALTKDEVTMTPEQLAKAQKELRDGNRDLQQKVTEFQDDLNGRQNEELSKLQKALVEEVQNFALAQKFDLVLADGVIFTSPTLDITPQILTALQSRSAARPTATGATPAPAATQPRAQGTPGLK